MLKYFIILSVLLSLYCGEEDQSEAYAFARQHYQVDKFLKFYEDFRVFYNDSLNEEFDFIFGYDSLTLYNKYKDSLDLYEEDLFWDIQFGPFLQGWDDCEPYFDSTNGFNLDSMHVYSFYYTYYNADTTWLLNRHAKSDTTLLEPAIMGYSQNCLTYISMLW